jgi:hypothetical protein
MALRIGGALVAALALAAIVIAVSAGGGRSATRQHRAGGLGRLTIASDPGALGSEGVPVPQARALAPAGAPAGGRTVDGIQSAPLERLAFHIHAHLTVFVRGRARQVPYGIGIEPPLQVQLTPHGPFAVGTSGIAWLHTHAPDGIIHIESPIRTRFTLGQFFDVWGQPLGPRRVGPARGMVTAFYNGRHFLGDPREIPLTAHAQIELAVGRPLPALVSIAFPRGL